MHPQSNVRLNDTHAPLDETLEVLAQREFQQRRRFLRSAGMAGATVALMPLSGLACTLIPAETAGPYPGDGTNGPNALTQSGILRADIRSSFGSSGTTMATGTLLLVTLKLVSTTDCSPLSGLAVYLWHCDANGGYSMYSAGVANQNYLRGVQVSNNNGEVTFISVFPGCYSGRWPHIHFEVYVSQATATVGGNAIRTSQLALPEAACRQVYAQSTLYPSSVNNLNAVTLNSDNVFGDDGGIYQLASTTGSIGAGYEAVLEVGVNMAPNTSLPLFADGFE